MKIQQGKTGQYTITLPKEIVRLKQWGKGTTLALIANDKGDLLMKEVK